MTPDAYCRDQAAPPGSSLYYSLFSLADGQRRTLTAVYALRREMAGLATASHDPGVAQAKLNWWREELQRLFAGRPRHPVSQALAAPDGVRMPQQPLQDLLDGAAMDLAYNAYPDFATLSPYCRRLGGAINRLAAVIVDAQRAPEAGPFADALGVALELTRILRNAPLDARQGRCYLPADELRRYGLSHADLLKTQTKAPLRDLFREQIDRIRQQQRQALDQLPEPNRYAQRPALIRLALDRALLDEIEADGYRLLEQRLSLTPLRKFWIAWRVVRHERRRQRRASG